MRWLWAIVPLVLLPLGVAAVLVNSVIEDRLRDAIDPLLPDEVTYEGVRWSPFGTLGLEDVTFVNRDESVDIDLVAVDVDRDTMLFMLGLSEQAAWGFDGFEVRGVHLPMDGQLVQDLEEQGNQVRWVRDRWGDPHCVSRAWLSPQRIRALGYDELVVDVSARQQRTGHHRRVELRAALIGSISGLSEHPIPPPISP